MVENKSSFFQVTIDIIPISRNNYQLQSLENCMDLVLSSMKVGNLWYKFIQINKEEIVYLFKSEDRKRRGQLDRYCASNIENDLLYTVKNHSSAAFHATVDRLKKNVNFKLSHHPQMFDEYKADDIKVFDDPKKWHAWQKEIYNLIFEKDKSYKKPDQRKIISIVDKKGNSGKSSFFKWLYYNHSNTIGRIGYGSASQLRSSSVKIGKKDLYIIDLARAKSKDDKQEDLLSVLEDLKSGFVTNAMYGNGGTLIMEPPHIIVSSNYVLDYRLLSEDRWLVFEILPSNKLKPLDPKKVKVSKSKK